MCIDGMHDSFLVVGTNDNKHDLHNLPQHISIFVIGKLSCTHYTLKLLLEEQAPVCVPTMQTRVTCQDTSSMYTPKQPLFDFVD